MLISGASKQISSPRGILLNLSEYLFELTFTAIIVHFIQSDYLTTGGARDSLNFRKNRTRSTGERKSDIKPRRETEKTSEFLIHQNLIFQHAKNLRPIPRSRHERRVSTQKKMFFLQKN